MDDPTDLGLESLVDPSKRYSLLDRLEDWVESLPDWLRPVFYGPFILYVMILAKGGIILLPIGIVILMVRGIEVLPQTGVILAVLALVTVGAALGGLMFGLIGRHLIHRSRAGRIIAGVLSVAPYVASIVPIVRARNGQPPFGPLATVDWVVFSLCTLFFGYLIGEYWFSPD